jgi:hypothetical protein
MKPKLKYLDDLYLKEAKSARGYYYYGYYYYDSDDYHWYRDMKYYYHESEAYYWYYDWLEDPTRWRDEKISEILGEKMNPTLGDIFPESLTIKTI